jgi:predicted phage terminase large subunit-like protein
MTSSTLSSPVAKTLNDALVERARREVAKRKAQRSFLAFIHQAWPHLVPDEFSPNWHIDAMAENLQALAESVFDGKHTERDLIINVPPSSSKSSVCTILWPCWVWTRWPHARFICASYAHSLSEEHSKQRRALIQSEWYQHRWPITFKRDGDRQDEFKNTKNGTMKAVSVGGATTGYHAHILIVDDPLNPKQAASDAELRNANDYCEKTLPTRYVNANHGRKVIVMQRLHESDPTGRDLELGDPKHICLPMEYDPEHPFAWEEDPRKEKGELLMPNRYSATTLPILKRKLGSYHTAGQLQQLPAPADGGIFKRDWFKYYKPEEVNIRNMVRFATVDLAASTKTSADYTVISCWAACRKTKRLFLFDHHRQRLEAPDALALMERLCARHDLGAYWVESAGYQLSMIQHMRRAGLPVRKLQADKDKVSRALAATPEFEAGNVLFLDGASWLGDLQSEMLAFPNGKHDDQVDTISYGVRALKRGVLGGTVRQ